MCSALLPHLAGMRKSPDRPAVRGVERGCALSRLARAGPTRYRRLAGQKRGRESVGLERAVDPFAVRFAQHGRMRGYVVGDLGAVGADRGVGLTGGHVIERDGLAAAGGA
ncbi:Uncharacterised protein [Mycobacteroides abscessus subsp. abscessus]|nr:Uncharacterised protein [Mycobacteroides abscessus subsp. abscessus]